MLYPSSHNEGYIHFGGLGVQHSHVLNLAPHLEG
jgi:hypothetical protein